MTTILPAERTPWEAISNAIGQGLSQTLPQVAQQRAERSQIQQGLSQLSQTNPELKPLLSFLSSVAGTRQGAQYAEALAPEITKIMQTRQQTSPGVGTALEEIQTMLQNRQPSINFPQFGQRPQEPTYRAPTQQFQASQPSFDEISRDIKNKLGEQYFPFANRAENVPAAETKRPQIPPRPPKPIGPAEEDKMRASLFKQGITRKELQEDYINKIKQNQADEYKAAQEGFKSFEAYQKARTEEDDRFFNAVSPALKDIFPGMGPEEENIWRGIARTNEDIGTDEARFRDANQRYNQLVEQPLAAFVDTGPALPHFSKLRPDAVKDAVDDSRSIIQDHLNTINKMPVSEQFPKELKGEITNYLRKKYRTEMLAKDFGVAQAAFAVSNLSDKSKHYLDAIPKYPVPEAQGLEPFEVPDKIRESLTNKLAEALMKISPEDSLILVRDFAIHKDYPDFVFNRALNMAMKNGLTLSDFQRQEKPELSIPQRIDLESILRGKRSIFDSFKGKK
jgi:hypothetical protein